MPKNPVDPAIGQRKHFARPATAVVTFRQLERADGEIFSRFFGRLSQESLYRRFLSPIHRLDQAHPRRLLDIDHQKREAIIGLLGEEIIGIARFGRTDSGSGVAELAVVVADRFQRLGVATQLLSRLAIRALARGITEFTFTTQSENLPIIRLVQKLTSAPRLRFTGPVVEGCVDVLDLTGYSRVYPIPEPGGQALAATGADRPQPRARRRDDGLASPPIQSPLGRDRPVTRRPRPGL